jgi:hypothetical protein
MLRAGDRLGEPTLDPQGQFDYFGNPALPGTIGVPQEAMDADGRIRSPWGNAGFGPRRRRRSERPADPAGGLRRDDTTVVGAFPATPRRLLRLRWIALGGAVVWTSLVLLEFFMATTTVTTSPGHHRTETAYGSSPAAALSFAVLLVAFDAVTGVDFVRRVRADSERWGVAGAVCAGLLGVLGVLSLATVGLSMLLLAFLLFAVARPIRPPVRSSASGSFLRRRSPTERMPRGGATGPISDSGRGPARGGWRTGVRTARPGPRRAPR